MATLTSGIFEMNSIESFHLDMWKGDYGLPSVDIECLKVLAYAKFCDIPLNVRASNNPFKTPTGQLPVLRFGSNVYWSEKDILECFRSRNHNLDSELSSNQRSEIMAYDTFLKDKIYPALQFIWWIDQKNLSEITRPWYAKALPFPLNFYYPGKFEKQATIIMESLFPTEDDLSSIENIVYSEAQKCLTALSTRLGESNYFFGSKPTTLDALVFAYLAPLLKIPLPNPTLQNHLKGCSNLEKFVCRILQKYFEDDYREYEKSKAEEDAKRHTEDVDGNFPDKTRNQIFAGLFAAIAMMTYAFSSGVVEVLKKDDDQSYGMESFDEQEDYE